MQSIQEKLIVELILLQRKDLYFPEGIGGFETDKYFTLIANPREAPLLWLESTSFPELTFIAVDPFLFFLDYSPEFEEEMLDVEAGDEILILCLARGRGLSRKGLAINTAAPLIINWTKGIGKQVTLKNGSIYSLEQKIASG